MVCHLFFYKSCSDQCLHTHLIHLIPDWVEILLDHITLKCELSNIDLGIGVTFSFHHTTHHVIFGDQTLGLQQDDSQQPLKEGIV